MRDDLLSLTTDDLVLLGNRGIVKRAQQELQSGQLSCAISEDESGAVYLRWSDEIECVLPAGVTISNARCSCPATEICRHLIRSVLAYQQQSSAIQTDTQNETSVGDSPSDSLPSARIGPQTVWNPGTISDEDLAKQIPTAVLKKARRLFDEGQVIDLLTGAKPAAWFHSLSCQTRFLVPNNLHYTHCDCAESAPCLHVPLAVWAFRKMKPDALSELITTNRQPLDIPHDLMAEIEKSLSELIEIGISGAPRVLLDRFRRLENQARAAGLVWPAEILADIVRQAESYASHDARFSASEVAALIAELCTRLDAIGRDTGAVPQLFIRGSKADVLTETGSARLIGLGCEARIHRGGVELAAYMQDADSGSLVAVCRDFNDPAAGETPKEFWQLAQSSAMKGVPLAAVASGQLLIKGGKRTPDSRFIAGRAQISFSPQAFRWESLRAPLLVEDYHELRARLSVLPPASLRPRRITEDLYVLRVASVRAAGFIASEQLVKAQLLDGQGSEATLAHPFVSRARSGTDALLAALQSDAHQLQFVAGRARLLAAGLLITPIALVFENGGARRLVQPWIDRNQLAGTNRDDLSVNAFNPSSAVSFISHPLSDWLSETMRELGELLLLGLHRSDHQTLARWMLLQQRATALGLVRMLRAVEPLTDALQHRQHSLSQDEQSAAPAVKQLLALVHLAQMTFA